MKQRKKNVENAKALGITESRVSRVVHDLRAKARAALTQQDIIYQAETFSAIRQALPAEESGVPLFDLRGESVADAI